MAAHFVVIASKLPLLTIGVRSALASRSDIRIVEECSTFAGAVRALRRHRPHVLIAVTAICSGRPDALAVLKQASPVTDIALLSTTAAEFDMHMLASGARAVLPPETLSEQLVDCVHALAAGKRWRGLRRIRRAMPSALAQPGPGPTLHTLTARERQIAHAVATGKRNREIARALGISPATVKLHVSRIFEKLRVRNRVELLRKMMME